MRIIHTADIHLDSPLAGLAAKAGARAGDLVGATRRAFTAMVDYAIETEVELVLIAGDLYDGDWRDFSTGLFFVAEMARLERAGIRVAVIKGNHDAESVMTRALTWPKNVKIFRADRAETWLLDDLAVAVHGRSFPKREVTENIAREYPAPVPGFLNIAMLHTALDGRLGHDPYAPCTAAELVATGHDYWALGHVHNRTVLNERPWVVFPGNLQGRHANETGPKGVTLLTAEEGEIVDVEHVPLDVVRWARIDADATGCSDFDDVLGRMREAMAAAVEAADGRALAARVTISGETKAHSEIAGDLDRINAECLGLAAQSAGDVWIERVVVSTSDAQEAPLVEADAIAELLLTVDEIRTNPEELEPLRAELEQALARMPAKVRELGGLSELDEEAMGALLNGAAATLRHRLAGHD